jgi:hypothetical protein
LPVFNLGFFFILVVQNYQCHWFFWSCSDDKPNLFSIIIVAFLRCTDSFDRYLRDFAFVWQQFHHQLWSKFWDFAILSKFAVGVYLMCFYELAGHIGHSVQDIFISREQLE